jgi:hypothetical protein
MVQFPITRVSNLKFHMDGYGVYQGLRWALDSQSARKPTGLLICSKAQPEIPAQWCKVARHDG